MNPVVFSSASDEWTTPRALFEELNYEFGFCVDLAARAENALCDLWFGPDHPNEHLRDALEVNWRDFGPRFCNPPYSRGLQKHFIAKAIADRDDYPTVLLLPARTDTKVFHTFLWDDQQHMPRPGIEIRLLKGRLKFGGNSGGSGAAPFPSMVVVVRSDRLRIVTT